MTGLTNQLKQGGGSFLTDLPSQQYVISADGAIDVTLAGLPSSVVITKGSACVITIAAPISGSVANGGQDGVRVSFISTTAFAHTVTNSSPGFNNNGASSDVGTFGAAKGNGFTLEAYGGAWYVLSNIGVTLA